MPIRYYQEIDDDTGGAPLRREISIATVSDAVTLPDNPGAGRTLDKALVRGGERLEHIVTWVLSRARRGPTSSIKDIVRAVYQSLMIPRACDNRWNPCRYWGTPCGITAPPTAYELPAICEWLVYAANDPARCPECGARMTEQDIPTPLKSSKKIVKLISATNKSSCYISLQLLTLLVNIFPSYREVFADMGAWDVLCEISERMSDQLDVDMLLASSRRALVSLADTEILSLGKMLEVRPGKDTYYAGTERPFKPLVSELIEYFSHPEKRLLALTVAHRFSRLLDAQFFPVLNTVYPLLLTQLTSSNDPVEVAVLADSLYRVIDVSIPALTPWLIQIIKTRLQLLENIPYRLRSLILEGLPAKYEQRAIDIEESSGRRINEWRRAIWKYDPDDPEGEPDDDHKFFKWAARDDGKFGLARIDRVWWEAPVWETCDKRKWRLEVQEEQGTEDRTRSGCGDHRGRRPRAQSMTIAAWPCWMEERQRDEAVEWGTYWGKPTFVNFTGWPRKVGIWLAREREPVYRYLGDRDWIIFWTNLSTRMRSHSVD